MFLKTEKLCRISALVCPAICRRHTPLEPVRRGTPPPSLLLPSQCALLGGARYRERRRVAGALQSPHCKPITPAQQTLDNERTIGIPTSRRTIPQGHKHAQLGQYPCVSRSYSPIPLPFLLFVALAYVLTGVGAGGGRLHPIVGGGRMRCLRARARATRTCARSFIRGFCDPCSSATKGVHSSSPSISACLCCLFGQRARCHRRILVGPAVGGAYGAVGQGGVGRSGGTGGYRAEFGGRGDLVRVLPHPLYSDSICITSALTSGLCHSEHPPLRLVSTD